MTVSSVKRLLTAAALLGMSIGLAGCMSGTTYGTGVDPGTQTLQDLAGIAAMSGPKKDPIEYGARPPVVAPPKGTPLPPPGSQQAALATNWPKDPDKESKAFKAEMEARSQPADGQPYGANDPKFRLPPKPKSDAPDPSLIDPNRRLDAASQTTASQAAAAQKIYADSRGGGPTDANGLPVRQYLTDPPAAYRAPDPNAPVEVDPKANEQKGKFRWPWQ